MPSRTTRISTAGRPPAEQAEYWRHVVSSAFGPLHVRPPHRDGFAAGLVGRALGPVQAAEVRAPAHAVTRSARQVDRDTRECYKLGLVLRGTCLLRQNGHDALVRPGHLVLYDLTRPVEIAFTAHRIVTVLIPHQAIAVPPARLGRLGGTVLTERTRSGRLVASLMAALAEDGDTADGPHAPHLGEALVELVTGAISEHLGEQTPPPDPDAEALWHAVRDWIEKHLPDPALTPATIAEAHHLSVRQLYRVFQARGTTVAGYVRTRRLERCRRDLRDPRLADRTIGAIAAHWGFPDAATFSRAFRTAYGVTPTTYRSG
ncbi:MAG TPA: helix-turn-helix domain-containing protein [Thermomonospora sp.]|nr:helix-turn-helix domain-containing protein [Thermomonospora sp.]